MPNEVLIKSGTAIVLADTTDYSPATINNLGARTHQIDLTSLAAGAWRQSAKVDFGATRGAMWDCTIAFEPNAAPTAGERVDVYIGFSTSGTAAQDNPGNLSGSDGAWVGYGAASTDADEAANQLERIGSLILSADATVQVGNIGEFVPKLRYGIIVVRNSCATATGQSDAVEMAIRLTPVVDEVQ